MPDHQRIRSHKHLQWLGRLLHDPNLWHFNRRSVAGAFSVGLFAAFIPLPFQMAIAAAMAIPARVNLPISVGLVWLTNPITMPPLFYAAYKLGSWLLGVQPLDLQFEPTFDWLKHELGHIWQPFLLGNFLLAALCATGANLIIRLLWRLHVVRYLKRKRAARDKQQPLR